MVVIPLALILLLIAITWSGRLFAVAALLVAVAPSVGLVGHMLGRRSWMRNAWGMAGVALVIYVGLCLGTPAAKPSSAPRVSTLSSSQPRVWTRFSPATVLPEADQFALGATLMTPIDPLLTVAQAGQLWRLIRGIYGEMDGDPEFRALPSALPQMYSGMWSTAPAEAHAFLYVPPGLDRAKPAPALVFLHGSGGNFKGYLWVLSKLADRLHCVVIAPSYGFGNWRSPDTEQMIDAALAAARQTVSIDESKLYLSGLSNGGLGVSQSLRAAPSRWAAAIFISPVFDGYALAELKSTRALADKRVIVISGELDDRVPMDYVQSSAAELERAGAKVALTNVKEANHFLILSHRNQLVDTLARELRPAGKRVGEMAGSR